MAKRIIWTRQAQEDRILILKYWNIKNQSKIYSKKLNLLLKKAVALISEMPNIGRRTEEILKERLTNSNITDSIS
jgi:plasmid stabilization system protein ParE